MASGQKNKDRKMSEREWKRKRGFEMLKRGKKKSEISRRLGVDRKTVYNWSVRIERERDWEDKKPYGRPEKLTKEQKDRLKTIIDSGPRNYGYDTDLWTLKRIAEVISREFGVSYRFTHVWYILKSLNYSAQMPMAVAMEKNQAYVKEWLKSQYPE